MMVRVTLWCNTPFSSALSGQTPSVSLSPHNDTPQMSLLWKRTQRQHTQATAVSPTTTPESNTATELTPVNNSNFYNHMILQE